MIRIEEKYIELAYADMVKLRDVIADLASHQLELIHDAKNNNWLIVNHDHSVRYIIEEEYQNEGELRNLAGKGLKFLLE